MLPADAMGSPVGMEEARAVMGAWGDIGGMYVCDCTRELWGVGASAGRECNICEDVISVEYGGRGWWGKQYLGRLGKQVVVGGRKRESKSKH